MHSSSCPHLWCQRLAQLVECGGGGELGIGLLIELTFRLGVVVVAVVRWQLEEEDFVCRAQVSLNGDDKR